jgi:recombination protein RecR
VKIPRPISRLIDNFQRLPGIGPKTAQRLTFQLLHFPQEELEKFADALKELKKETKMCEKCKNVSEEELCSICKDDNREQRKIIVVSSVLDVYALEKAGYDGVYHVLHGVIDPLNNIGPEEIFIKELLDRVQLLAHEEGDREQIEIILATGSGLEGESTSMYISKMLRDGSYSDGDVIITRIARGIPVGGDIEYADDVTLSKALEGRTEYI